MHDPRSKLRSAVRVAVAVATLAAPSGAHHGSSVGRIDAHPAMTGPADAVDDGDQGVPRMELSLHYYTASFDRAVEGSTTYTEEAFGSVFLRVFHAGATVEFASNTQLGVALPFGTLERTDTDGVVSSSPGLGDVHLFVAQDLAKFWSTQAPAYELDARVGALLPTGDYDRDARLVVTASETDADGGVSTFTHDNRSNLGMGAFALSTGLDFEWHAARYIRPGAGVSVVQPLTETVDEIQWGTDVTVDARATFPVLGERLEIAPGIDYHFHGHDELPLADPQTGQFTSQHVGGGNELGAVLGVRSRIVDPLRCAARPRLPVWQHVEGIQLVESFSVVLGCSLLLEM